MCVCVETNVNLKPKKYRFTNQKFGVENFGWCRIFFCHVKHGWGIVVEFVGKCGGKKWVW